jgi:predicted nucleic-acid-binding protein
VLSSCYDLSGERAANALEAMVRSKQLVVERSDLVVRALRIHADGKADFPDCLIERSASAAGCVQTMTFDARAAKYAGMALVE